MSLGARIKTRRKQLNISQEKLADMLGVTPQMVSLYEKDKNHPAAKRFDQIEKVLDCSIEWLLFGSGVQKAPRVDFINVPLIGIVQAGIWREDVEGEPEEFVQFEKPPLNLKNYTCLIVKGDSMNKRLNDGDRLLCAEIHEYAAAGHKLESGDLVVVQRKKAGLYESTIKELEIKSGEYILHPRSTNPKHQLLRFKPDPNFIGSCVGINEGGVRIIGIVLARWEQFKKF